ncbi:MAG: macro domain-containing protein [Microscillaceae bacterium]|jgi:O-acetyl-ADP-ribose deacetylase (regulator of RNase III)|nr:macro domain-containing protein [Microscillaceae bacterium]
METPADFELILVDPNSALCKAWQRAFEGLANVQIVNDYFEKLPEFDCMVSAANSFGLMDGGVDLAIIRFFGIELQNRVQAVILEDYLGEQPVGTSFIVETQHSKHPYLAHTPTMRVPLPITRTDNVYLAMAAMLKAVYRHNQNQTDKIKSVACPGLGTATGKVSPNEAALQMFLAYKNFKNPPKKLTWEYAGEVQKEVIFGGDLW